MRVKTTYWQNVPPEWNERITLVEQSYHLGGTYVPLGWDALIIALLNKKLYLCARVDSNIHIMALKYEFYHNPNNEDSKNKKFHARIVPNGRISTDRLAQEIQKESSLTVADVKSVLIALADKMAEHLGEGHKVYLEGIGYFQVNLHCKEEVDTNHGVRSEIVEFKSVSFRADADLKKSLKKEKIQRSRNKPHSMPMTEEEIDEKLTEHFAKNPILTRRDFEFQCMQVRTTACRILRKLVEAGKLKNISTTHNPVYVPNNGHYASNNKEK